MRVSLVQNLKDGLVLMADSRGFTGGGRCGTFAQPRGVAFGPLSFFVFCGLLKDSAGLFPAL